MSPRAVPADRFELERAVRVGLWATVAMLPALVAYPFLPGHAPVDLAAYSCFFATIGSVAVAAPLLRRRLLSRLPGRRLVYVWSLVNVGLISAGVAVTGGARSPLFLCYALTALFVTSCYPLRAQLGVVAASLFGYVAALLVAGGPLEAASLILRGAVILLVTALGASIANEKDRTARESQRRAALLAVVADVARGVSGAESSKVFASVLEATEQLGFEYAHLSVLDAEGRLRLLRCRGIPEAILAAGLKAHLGMMGLVARERATVWLDDYSAHERAVPEFAALELKTTIGSPIVVDGTLVGVLSAASSHRRPLPAEDLEAFELLAGVASRAFEGARRFEQLAASEARMRHVALHDELTGLANRFQLNARLDEMLARSEGGVLTLVVFDLDDFKRVNDTLGHAAGDELLVSVAERIGALFGEAASATLARLSGDEFGLLLDGLDERGVEDLARRLLEAVAAPTRVAHRRVVATASVGIARTDLQAVSREERAEIADRLMREADLAMYEAKRAGKGRYVVFDQTMNQSLTARRAIEDALVEAIESNEMAVVYQPIVDLATLAVTGFEALVRWRSPLLASVPSSELIQLAEESGAIVPLGRSVLRRACEALQLLRRANPNWAGLEMSVNLSTRQLRDPGLVEDLLVVLAETWVPPSCLILEITESSLLQDAAACEEKLHVIAGLGVAVALDDFGTGYSSLSCLQRLEVQALKIDRSFVDGLAGGNTDAALVQSIVNLAGALGLSTVAEGVETSAQLEVLRALGCARAQGFLFARPLPAERLADFVAAHSPLAFSR